MSIWGDCNFCIFYCLEFQQNLLKTLVTTTNDKILNTIGTAYLFNLDITWSRLTISYTVSATNKRFRNIVKWANQVSIDFREIAAFEDLPHNCDDQFFDFAKKDFPFSTLVTIRDLKMKNWSFIVANVAPRH